MEETCRLYSSWEWRYGKSPECETSYSRRFGWGELEIWLKLYKMYISGIKVYSDALDVELPGILERIFLGKRYDLADLDLEQETAGCKAEQRQRINETADWLSGLWKE